MTFISYQWSLIATLEIQINRGAQESDLVGFKREAMLAFAYLKDGNFLLSSDKLYFPGDSDGKESACNVGDLGFIPGLGRSPGTGKGYPLQYSGLENSMDCMESCKELNMTEKLSLSLL